MWRNEEPEQAKIKKNKNKNNKFGLAYKPNINL